MNYNFVILRTDKGGRYARKIMRSIEWLNANRYPQHKFYTEDWTIGEFLIRDNEMMETNLFYPENTIFHARCANPRTKWTEKLRGLEENDIMVVNSVDCIELTSNKLACSLHLQGKVNHPKSWEYSRDMGDDKFMEQYNKFCDSLGGEPEYFIAKPLTSLEQGANVRKIFTPSIDGIEDIRGRINRVPGNKIVIQEYIPYDALHRVIVIGGKALPYTFVDRPEWHPNDWKVSCCLNRTTMQFNGTPDKELLELAEQTQKEVNGEINFIDIFEYGFPDERPEWPMYTNAEINTACSLNIHEELAKQAGHPQWNIHYRIAKHLVERRLGII